MGAALRTVRMIQIAMLASVLAYVVIGELTKLNVSPNHTILYALSAVSISLIGAILVVRRTLVIQSEVQLRQRPGDAAIINRWKAGHIVTYALCEALGLFGLLLRLLGFPRSQVWPYYAGAFALLLLLWPRLPQGVEA